MLQSKEHLRRRPQKIWFKSEKLRIASARCKERKISENNFEILFKCIRIIFCVGCFLGFTFHVTNFLNVYFQYPTRMEFSVTFNEEQSAPAISIANINRLRKSALCKRYDCRAPSDENPHKGLFKRKQVKALVDDMMLNLDGTFLMNSGHQLKDIIEPGQWNGHKKGQQHGEWNGNKKGQRQDKKNKQSRKGMGTKKEGNHFGNSTSPGDDRGMNSSVQDRRLRGNGGTNVEEDLIPLNWNLWKNRKNSKKSTGEGRRKRMNETLHTAKRFVSFEHGNTYMLSTNDIFRKKDMDRYSFIINVESQEYFEPLERKSLKLVLHDPTTPPRFDSDAVEIEGGNAYYIRFKKTQNKMLPKPFSSRCRDYETETGDISKNQSSFFSSSLVCKRKILNQMSLKLCKCYLLNKIISLNEAEAHEKCKVPENNLELCNNKTQEARKGVNLNDLCPIECSSFSYDASVIKKPLQNTDDFRRLLAIRNTINEDDLAQIWISFTDYNLDVHSLTPQYQSMEMFSFIGGYMGIWLGLSFLQLPAYSLSLYSWYQRKRRIRPVRSKLRHRAPTTDFRIY